MNKRKIHEHIFKLISYLAGITTVLILFGILGKITIEAMPSLSLYYILTPESDSPRFGGAIANAIVGTVFLSVLSTAMATPAAVGTAIYLKRYAKDSHFARMIGFVIDVLAGTPTIVIGLFGLLVLVFYLRPITGGFSLISGSIALAILIIPVIERAAEKAIERVPHDIEEASYAMGATRWDTLRLITLPYALTGIVTGIVLSIGRAAEASAVIILTAGYTQFLPEFKVLANERLLFGIKIYPFQDLVAALPITVYHAYEFPHFVSPSEGFAAAFVLIVIVMLINATTRLLLWKRRIG
ncbi:MAG: phosphate ABC transporter permease PstA [Methanolobus sp.]|nr:phosphate ABC transporter permease PstA [Methanolobus sp.]